MFNKGRYQEFREELAKLKWEEILAKKNHIDVNWEIFITKFKELEKELIPIKSTDQKRKGREKFSIDEKTRKKTN